MSKNNEGNSSVPTEVVEKGVRQFTENDYLQDNTPLFIRGFVFKNLEGRLLTLVESMGLPEKQEEAVKGYMRREVWGTVYQSYHISDAIMVEIDKTFCAGIGN